MGKLPVYTASEQARSAGLLRNSEISAEAMGAGIGRAVGGLGEAIGGLAGSIKDRSGKRDMTNAQIAVANLTGETQIKMAEMEAGAPPDGAGFSDGYKTYFDNAWGKLINDAPTEDVRNYYREKKATLGASMLPQAFVYEATKSAGNAKQQTSDALSGIYSTIQRDPTMFNAVHEQGVDLISNHYALRGDDAQELLKTFNQTASATYFETAIQSAKSLEQIGMVKKQIADGSDKIAGMLAPTDLKSLTDQVARQENGIRTGLKARVEADATAVIAQLKAGQDVDPEYVNTLLKNVTDYADPATQRDFNTQLGVSKFSKALKGSTPDQLDDAMRFGQPAQGGVTFMWRNRDRRGTGGYSEIPNTDARLAKVSPVTVNRAVSAYKSLGIKELRVNSGHRDRAHNEAVGGAKNSQHILGSALDLDVSMYSIPERIEIIRRMSAAGITGIGVYDNSIHVDSRKGSRAGWGPTYSSDSIPAWAAGVMAEHLGNKVPKSAVNAGIAAPVAYQQFYTDTSNKYDIPVEVLIAIGHKETGGFRPDVIDGTTKSAAGAAGIAQFMPDTAKELGVDPLNVEQSIDGKGRYMRQMLDKYDGNLAQALAAYNWGTGNLDNAGGDWRKGPKETRDYVETIMGWVNGDQDMPDSLTEYYRVTAAGQVKQAYDVGMKDDAAKFTIGYVPQFFPDDAPDMQTGEGLGARFKGIDAARDYLDEPGIKLLTADEIQALSTSIDGMSADEKLALAGQIHKELGGNAKEVYKLLEKTQPDMAYAGLMIAHDASSAPVAYEMIQGREAVIAKYPDMAPEKAMAEMFKGLEAEDRVPTDIEQVLAAYPQRLADVTRAADHLYTIRSLRQGFSNEFKSEQYRTALEDAMGSGVAEVNGAPVLLPKGINADQMNQALDFMRPEDLQRLSVRGGSPVYASVTADGGIQPLPIDAEDFANEAQLEAFGQDTYAVKLRLGKDYLFDSKAVNETSNPIDAVYLIKLTAEDVMEINKSGGETIETMQNEAAPQDTIVERMRGVIDPDKDPAMGGKFVVPPLIDDKDTKAKKAVIDQIPKGLTGYAADETERYRAVGRAMMQEALRREQSGLPALSVEEMMADPAFKKQLDRMGIKQAEGEVLNPAPRTTPDFTDIKGNIKLAEDELARAVKEGREDDVAFWKDNAASWKSLEARAKRQGKKGGAK